MADAVLYIFSGLPGSGKSTLACMLSRHLKSVYLRIDTIEQALRDLCALDVEGEGYRLAYRVAADNLRLGNCVVVDACNPISLTRTEWGAVADEQGLQAVNIEIICSDQNEHRQRIEERKVDIIGLIVPTWEEVQRREYHPWGSNRIVIDTSNRSSEASLVELLDKLNEALSP